MAGAPVKKFDFDTVFDAGGNVLCKGSWQERLDASEIEARVAAAYEQGKKDELVLVEKATEQAVKAVAEQASLLLKSVQDNCNNVQQQAVSLALAIGKKIAGAALDHYEIDQVRWLVQKTLSEFKGTPKIIITVSQRVAEQLQSELDSLSETASFGGRIRVETDEQARSGAVRICWSEGAVQIDPDELEARIEQDVSNWFADTTNMTPANNQQVDKEISNV